jgi:hypothetical protein
MPYRYGSSARPARTRVVFGLVKTTAEEAMPHELLDERLIGPFMVFYPA